MSSVQISFSNLSLIFGPASKKKFYLLRGDSIGALPSAGLRSLEADADLASISSMLNVQIFHITSRFCNFFYLHRKISSKNST
jgi:hypothetical protein